MATATATKVALGVGRYVRPFPIPFNRKISEQMEEYYGLGSFHCPEHQILATSLKEISSSYKKASSQDKKTLALNEILAWKTYISEREKILPDSYKIPEKTHARLHRIWGQTLHYEKVDIECKRMLDFHTKYVEHYQYDVPLDKRSLFEMIHPHAGYMNLLPLSFTFEDLISFYKVQIVASYERSLGEDILSRSISCYNYYRLFLDENVGHVDKKKCLELLGAFKFPGFKSLDEMKKYFDWSLKELDGEFDGMKDEEYFIRLNFARKIFLDYNL
ncbi:hypothetical protein SteCoe_36583 [Stentor coeruleus]|uniref:Uncharacterized protein n=1 Tax=Stentor coeruleus TaxID=5963 RepID=A0A1R2AQ15_9CILI|nr:hypothetical protein SteCoe_36583 [Stentor coeruleus]